MPKITFKDVVNHVADSTGETKRATEVALRQAFAFIATNVFAGNEVAILDFGTFKRKDRPARVGRNPKNGEPVNIAASQTLVFKATKHAKK